MPLSTVKSSSQAATAMSIVEVPKQTEEVNQKIIIEAKK